MLRLLMRMVQMIVECVPPSLRVHLRENALLASLYTAWLCKAKLHPSVNARIAVGNARHQFVEKGDRLYANCMAHHNALLEHARDKQSIVRHVDTCLIDLSSLVLEQPPIIEALLEQTLHSISCCYEHPKQVCIVYDAYKPPRRLLNAHKKAFNIKLVSAAKASAAAVKPNTCMFAINAGDLLHRECFSALNRANIQGYIAYVDTDKIHQGQRFDPAFFPDWNPDLHLSTRYIKTGLLIDKSEEYLRRFFEHQARVSSFVQAEYLADTQITISHLPFVLLHQQARTSEPEQPRDTSELFELKGQPLVSMIIPTYNGYDILKDCVESILEKTTYTHYDICVINNNSDDQETLEYLNKLKRHPKITVLDYLKPFNYSAINNFAVAQVKGDVIALMNNDVEIIEGDWLDKMLKHVMREDIGCVGAKLLYSNELVQHAGVVMGYGGGAGHAHKYLPKERPGYLQRAIATQNYSAVTAACLLVTREDYESVGGLNETDLTVAFNDVDFCLSILELGKRNVFVAEALLFHHESISRGHEDTLEKQKRFQAEVKYMQQKWAAYIEHDPAYNPNLTLRYENFSIRENLEQIPL
ncbi:glycosyltransferase [Glaciecola siphonariae]|uniref:Glycosyltransferase n=1 Tax=Glaciecola siphonariae TaxID=521012 RepID=A0ABV9LU64_9ALTE